MESLKHILTQSKYMQCFIRKFDVSEMLGVNCELGVRMTTFNVLFNDSVTSSSTLDFLNVARI